MSFVRSVLLLGLIVFPANFAAAENGEDFAKAHADFFHLLHPQKSEIEAAYTADPKREEDGGPGEFDLDDLSLNVDIPFPLSSDSFYSMGGTFQTKIYDFKEISSATRTSGENFYKGILQSGLGTFVTEDFLLQADTSFGFYNDLEGGIDGDSLRLFGEGQATYRLNPYTQVLAGIRASEDYDDTPVFPFVGVRLATTEGKIHFSITAPLEAAVTYNLDEKSLIYVGGWISGDEYLITSGPEKREFNAHVHDRRFGAGISYWLGKHLKLNLEAGASVGSKLEFKTLNPGEFSGGDLDPGPYGTVRLGWGL